MAAKSPQCIALSRALGTKVSYLANDTYVQSTSSYWSKQEESLMPSCIVTPTSTDDVATAVKILTLPENGGDGPQEGLFAIRGGGHTPWAGSANINDGVTIDLRSINTVIVNQDKTVASVGGGAIWGDVYRTMDSLGLAVVGGRGSSIGVGGLLTGGEGRAGFFLFSFTPFDRSNVLSLFFPQGGISYFSARKGFACDNVLNYEIVLASGQIVNANAHANPDLWLALKGGSNNFGIVTRFDLVAFPQGDFWGGSIIYDDSASPALLDAFAQLNKAVGFDEYAALILSFSYVSGGTGFLASANIEYTDPIVNPPTFQPFTSIQPQYANTMRISNQSDFTTEFIQYQPNGRR